MQCFMALKQRFRGNTDILQCFLYAGVISSNGVNGAHDVDGAPGYGIQVSPCEPSNLHRERQHRLPAQAVYEQLCLVPVATRS